MKNSGTTKNKRKITTDNKKPIAKKYIKVAILADSVENGKSLDLVRVEMDGQPFSAEEFTSLLMGLLETYTEGLLQKNDKKAVFDHWNSVFGKFLNKIYSNGEIYEVSEAHKQLKQTLEAEPNPAENHLNKVAAMVMARELLIEAGVTEETADFLIQKKIDVNKPQLKS